MANLYRVRTTMTGATGLPGVSTMYFRPETGGGDEAGAQAVAEQVFGFWDTVTTGDTLPVQVTYAIENPIVVISDETGNLLTTFGHDQTTGQAGGGASVGPSPAGAVIHWITSTVVNGRFLRGKTFLVPLCLAAYQAGGTIVDARLTSINTAAGNLILDEDNPMVVWHRPTTPGGANGSSAVVTSAVCPDKVAVLRSRRD